MATIQYIWNANGRESGIAVRRTSWQEDTHMVVLDIRAGQVVAWMYRDGHKAEACTTYGPTDTANWELYKPKTTRTVTLYAAIVISASSYGNRKVNPNAPIEYERTVALWETAEQCLAKYPDRFVKLQEHPVTTVEVPL